jgi:hypothetical protein
LKCLSDVFECESSVGIVLLGYGTLHIVFNDAMPFPSGTQDTYSVQADAHSVIESDITFAQSQSLSYKNYRDLHLIINSTSAVA